MCASAMLWEDSCLDHSILFIGDGEVYAKLVRASMVLGSLCMRVNASGEVVVWLCASRLPYYRRCTTITEHPVNCAKIHLERSG
jgi:hypothetical protein